MLGKWQTKEQLLRLLIDLVERDSVTGTKGEVDLGEYLYHLLEEQAYFKEFKEHLQRHTLQDGRSLVTALVKHGNATKTVVLLNHFDVVDVKDYGELVDFAFRPTQLVKELVAGKRQMPESVREDLNSGDWIFGRGTMDMKAGLTVQLSMLEQAINGEFEGNILLISVPDEEVNSTGMLSAVPILNSLKQRFGLSYVACINSEPMFAKYPNDPNHYIYTGSLGKALASFYCSGVETHVGEPFSGLNANIILSEINRLMELNDSFCEKVGDEVTPPPTSLMMRDLKEEYSVQIPHTSVGMYNLLIMNKSFSEIHNNLIDIAEKAARSIDNYYVERVKAYNKLLPFTPLDRRVNVFTYRDLLQKAIDKYGKESVERRLTTLGPTGDDRERSTRFVGELVSMCKELSPMIVVFYSPPFYPAVSSSEDYVVQKTVEDVISYASNEFQIRLHQQHYFPGLSDLSFVQINDKQDSILHLTENMPMYGNYFQLPFTDMKELNIPVLNIGPLGRDPHKWTERLNIPYTFDVFPKLLAYSINTLFNIRGEQ